MTYVYWGVGIYTVIGIANMFLLLQTPYAENPKLAMIFLWPWYWLAFLIGGR